MLRLFFIYFLCRTQVNYFVEQESIKTLIISNATEIQQNEYFLKIKEKLIGATFNYTED